MQTHLAPQYQDSAAGREAEAILRKCVHCGFCTATCPTYQLLGDELDGPRGRIYLIKQVLEGEAPTRKTQMHLDRCLTCRNCESTCPSGVQYGHLVDIGRQIVDEQVPRPAAEKAVRWLLKEGLPSPLFAPALKLGQMVRGALPPTLRAKVPLPQSAGRWPSASHARKVLTLAGCVQPALSPNINSATARVLDAAGIECVTAPQAGCCGAVKFHLNDQSGGLGQMRANIDAWWPLLSSGQVEALVINASGCGATIKDYGHLLRDDPAYAEKAALVSAKTRDLSELLPDLVPLLKPRLKSAPQGVVPSTRLARCSTARSCVAASRPTWASWALLCRWRATRPTCAAARPARTRCSTPTLPTSCATARWATWRPCSPRSSSAPTSVASPTCKVARRPRSSTGWRCSMRPCKPEPTKGWHDGGFVPFAKSVLS